MSDISKIKLGDETYNVKDARIVSGTADGEFTLEGSMILLCLTDVSNPSIADLWVNEAQIHGEFGADVTMSGTTMTVNAIKPCDYLAIIKD